MKAFLCIPNLGWVRKEVLMSTIELLKTGNIGGYMMPQMQPVEDGMNHAVLDFLKTDCDYFMCLDSDVNPHLKCLELMELDKDIIGCPYPMFVGGKLFLGALDHKDNKFKSHVPVEGLQEVDALGTGCILIHRRVLEKIKFPFKARWDKDGKLEMTHDYNFCLRAKNDGFRVWCSYDHICDHIKEMRLSDCAKLASHAV